MITADMVLNAAPLISLAILAIIPGHFASRKGRSFAAWWVGGMLLFPLMLIGSIIAWISDPDPDAPPAKVKTGPAPTPSPDAGLTAATDAPSMPASRLSPPSGNTPAS